MKTILLWMFAALLSLTVTRVSQAMTCTIGTATAIAFGAYDPLQGGAVDTTGSIGYRCDDVGGSDTIIVQLSRGNAMSYLPRTLTSGAYQLEYNLYLGPSHAIIWGDGSSGTDQLGPLLPENGVDTNVVVYGRIESGQNAHVGTYSDTVSVTVVF